MGGRPRTVRARADTSTYFFLFFFLPFLDFFAMGASFPASR